MDRIKLSGPQMQSLSSILSKVEREGFTCTIWKGEEDNRVFVYPSDDHSEYCIHEGGYINHSFY